MDPGFTAVAAAAPRLFAGIGTGALVALVIIFYLVFVIAGWRIFKKAGQHGWLSIIPIVNTIILFRITWGSGLFFLLTFIPFVNIIIMLITYHKLSKAFGHGILFTLGLIFLTPIFYLILGYGPSEYNRKQ